MSVLGKAVTWTFVNAPWVAKAWITWRAKHREAPPFVPLGRPLSEVCLGLVTTGGVHHRAQERFKRKHESPHGDASLRLLDLTRIAQDFLITHDWYQNADARADLNLVLPAERLSELARDGILGGVHPQAVALMGHVEREEEIKLEHDTAPAVARIFSAAGVDAVLLVPA